MAKEKPQLSEQMQEVIRLIRLHNRNGSSGVLREEVAEGLDISVWKARKLITQAETILAGTPKVGIDPSDPLFRSEVARRIKKQTTIVKIAGAMHSTEEEVSAVIDDMEERGYIILRRGNTVQLGKSVEHSPTGIVFENHFHDKPISFGVVADMHLCSKAERLDVLNAAYDEFARRGINTVLCPGNYIDGECRFNTHELLAHGIADQCQYAIDHWPSRPGIKTYFVDGDDHEGWFQQREGIEFGRYLMLEAQAQGRDDLVYMGYMEADFELKAPNGSAVIKVIHAGGGSSYAYSYASQKLAESFQGGEKPAVCIIGHYHKMEYCVSLDSEILTKNGWKKHNELTLKEEILGYNLETGLSEWTTLDSINVFPEKQLNYYSNAKFAVNCTPDHKWVWEQDGERFLASMSEVHPKWDNNRPMLIQTARAPDGPGLPQLKYQDLLEKETLVQQVIKMTSAERQAFLVGLMVGEGSRANSTISFAQNGGPVNDAFTLAAFLEGWAMGKPYIIQDSQTLRTGIFQKPHRDHRIRDALVKTTTETVWCPTTGLGTWVMRQNGQITITGNCFPRNVHCLQAGTMQDQTRFMRKRKLAAHVGFCIVTLQQDIGGSVTRFSPEFFPFWDRGYYLKRDGITERLQNGE
ncbi:hypothetical protein LCGC14_0221400 [marine sediment metagenome]|uniref:Hint domain-containing protein n=1 Tax=marine sediment metagenome TaxID=412755 RepID=A0A0F9UUX4_9ZZZZ